jgi:hypothetical protein
MSEIHQVFAINDPIIASFEKKKLPVVLAGWVLSDDFVTMWSKNQIEIPLPDLALDPDEWLSVHHVRVADDARNLSELRCRLRWVQLGGKYIRFLITRQVIDLKHEKDASSPDLAEREDFSRDLIAKGKFSIEDTPALTLFRCGVRILGPPGGEL